MKEIRIKFNGKDERYRVSDQINLEMITEEQIKELRENYNVLSLSTLLERDGNGFYRLEYILREIGDEENILCDFGGCYCCSIDGDINSIYSCRYYEFWRGYVIERYYGG